MGNTSKIISFTLCIALTIALLINLFSGKDTPPEYVDHAAIYAKVLSEIVPLQKDDRYLPANKNDAAEQYARLWEMPKIYKRAAKDCVDLMNDFHPTNVVQREKTFEYYGISIGTRAWSQMTSAYDHYVIEVCNSYSGYQIEDMFAEIYRNRFSDDELRQILDFYNTELGKKIIETNDTANIQIQNHIIGMQRAANLKQTTMYNRKLDQIYKKSLDEKDGGWLDKFFSKIY